MKFIAHRGNVDEKNPTRENTPGYIEEALARGFDVEIDVWHMDGSFHLGHDFPGSMISEKFLQDKGLWCHAKNIKALHGLLSIGANCFFHSNDDVVLTSSGYIWTFPGMELTNRSICVLPETLSTPVEQLLSCHGICSDKIQNYRLDFMVRS